MQRLTLPELNKTKCFWCNEVVKQTHQICLDTEINEILDEFRNNSFRQRLRLWFWKYDRLNELYFQFFRIGLINRITAPLRSLPDFMILGFNRSGNQSLNDYLTQHEAITSPRKKEIHFFSFGYHMGMNWYKAHFPIRKKGLILDSSPDYAIHPEALTRIKKHLPNCKFIVILRNPIDRSYSMYKELRNIGLEKYSFEDCIMQDESRLQYYLHNMKNYKIYRMPLYFPYLSLSKYDVLLKPYLDLFPKSSFCFLDFNDFYGNTDKMVNKVFSFLGVKNQSVDLKENNSAKYQPMSKTTREVLASYFIQHNSNLEKITGMTFNWDK